MRALWWNGNAKRLTYDENIPEPKISSPHDVKIQVAFSGICGSDFHFMSNEMGKFSPKQDGVILGHEFSGTIVEVGTAVKNFAVGDKVSVNPNSCCGSCDWAKQENPHFCEKNVTIGVKRDGGWAEFCVVQASAVWKLPASVPLDGGALAEPYSCVLRGWNMMDKKPFQSAKFLIQGAGIIGSMFACIFHVNGYKNVTICEPNEGRRNKVEGLGLGYNVLHPKELDELMAGKDADRDGFNVIFDCTGNCKAVEKTINLAARGAFISMFGCCPAGEKIQVEPFLIYWKELRITGSFVNPFCFGDAVDLLKNLKELGLLEIEKLGVRVFDLSEFENALDALKSGKAAKAMFKF